MSGHDEDLQWRAARGEISADEQWEMDRNRQARREDPPAVLVERRDYNKEEERLIRAGRRPEAKKRWHDRQPNKESN